MKKKATGEEKTLICLPDDSDVEIKSEGIYTDGTWIGMGPCNKSLSNYGHKCKSEIQ